MPLSVAVIDDVGPVVDGVSGLLKPYDDRVHVVSTQVGAVEPVEADIALVDAFGNPAAGVARVREASTLGCFGHTILYTWRMIPGMAVEAIDAGAHGIFTKSAAARRLVTDIELVAAGDRIIHEFPASTETSSPRDRLPTLSARESELLGLVAHGLTNREIATSMYLAESSVKTYMKRLYRKLEIHSRAEAIMRAVELGVTTI